MRPSEGLVVDRRAFIGTLTGSLLAAPLAAEAQPAAKVYRIGFLGNSTPALEANLVGPFREGLRDLNYVEGRNIVIEYRWAEGRNDRFAALVAEVVRLKVDVIVTSGTPATQAAKEGTHTIPVVVAAMGDPISAGVVLGLARPGGNVTGLASMSPEIDGKRLELLKELLPGVSRFAVIWNPTNPGNVTRLSNVQAAAKTLRVTLEPLVGAGNRQDLDNAFETIVATRAEALVIEPDRALLAHRVQIVDFATRRRLPALYPYREFVQAGGLMSYAPSYSAMWRAATLASSGGMLRADPADWIASPPSSHASRST